MSLPVQACFGGQQQPPASTNQLRPTSHEDHQQTHYSSDPAATPKNEFVAFSGEKACSHHPRSRSPRPKTLPGLVASSKPDKDQKIPGLAQLAGTALLNSPQAPQQVKAFAKTLVEGIITDCTVVQPPPTADDDVVDDEATDVSFSLAIDEQPITKDLTEDCSHNMDPDSLEESKDS